MAENDISVNLDGQTLSFDVPPQIINDRTMVPLRKIFEALGASVDWDQATKTVTATKGDTTIKLTIGSNIIYINDSIVTLDTPACVIDDRTLVPVRAISEAYDCYISWDSEQQTVLIYSENTDLYRINELILEYLGSEDEFVETYIDILTDSVNALKEGHEYYGVTSAEGRIINLKNDERFLPAKNNLLQICDKVFQYDTSELSSELAEIMNHVRKSAESIKDYSEELSLEVSTDALSQIHEKCDSATNEINIAVGLLTQEYDKINSQ